MIIEEALKQKVWAVLGASAKKDKFGYIIYKRLKDYGYTVYPVNPGLTEIDGDTCYKSLQDLPQTPAVVNFVVPDRIGLGALDECKTLGITTVWLQPGADKVAVIEKGKKLGLHVITACVLVELNEK